jgi:hypothetical protein
VSGPIAFADYVGTATLSGTQQAPTPVVSGASGVGRVVIVNDYKALVSLSLTNLVNISAVHLHAGGDSPGCLYL